MRTASNIIWMRMSLIDAPASTPSSIMKKFGYSGEQAYAILGTAPVEGHISGIVDIPNACATLWLPTEIFDFDIKLNANGPTKYLAGDVDLAVTK